MGSKVLTQRILAELIGELNTSTSRLIVGTSMVGSTLMWRIATWNNAYKKHTNHINRDRDNPLKTHRTISTRE